MAAAERRDAPQPDESSCRARMPPQAEAGPPAPLPQGLSALQSDLAVFQRSGRPSSDPGREQERSAGEATVPTPAGFGRLQRAIGNQALCRMIEGGKVIQRKPADINANWTLSYDSTGKLTNAPGVRAAFKRATAINSQLRFGLATPKVELTGGHLFKREFGGPDDETNVVPWKPDTESEFTVFEEGFAATAGGNAASAATTGGSYTATVHTEATFGDRDDLAASDGDLDKAGWLPTDPERQKRKDLFADVAEKFSGIPQAVKVEVALGGSDTRTFTKAGTDIAPAYVRNDAALDPAYAMIDYVFLRKATEPRLWKDADWTKKNSPVVRQLQHEWAHAADFGMTGPWNLANGKAFEATLRDFVTDTSHEQIKGVYRKEPVLHYIDATSGRWVSTKPDGIFFTSWRLGASQLLDLLTKGKVV